MIEKIIEAIKSRKDKKAKMAHIKGYIRTQIEAQEGLFVEPIEDIDREVQRVIKEELKKGALSRLKFTNGYYSVKFKKSVPGNGNKPNNTLVPQLDSTYEGAAGETAVISELLFNEYNANRMMVDKGIDIVATKNNVYYYVQVKTSYIKDGKVRWQIKKERFDVHISNQLKYVFVARYAEENKYKEGDVIWRSLFFVLSSADIERECTNGYIGTGEEIISVKILFNEQSGEPYLYHNDREIKATYYLNNFKW